MPHKDTSLAINKLYISIPNDGDDPPGYINTGFQCSKCHKDTSLAINMLYLSIPNDGGYPPGYISTQGFSALNATQGPKSSYTTSYRSIPN